MIDVRTWDNSAMPSILFSHVQIKEQAHVSQAWWMVAAHKSSRAEWQKCSAAVSLAAAGALEPFLKRVPWEALVSSLLLVSSGYTALGEWVPAYFALLLEVRSYFCSSYCLQYDLSVFVRDRMALFVWD